VKEHLVREMHLKETCIYCGHDLRDKKWTALHHREKLYMTHKCTCGRHMVVRLPFLGSGHDSWNHHNVSEIKPQKEAVLRTLESKIKILSKT